MAQSRPLGVARRRLAVHVGLILTTAISLWFEPILTVHVVFGLAFAALIATHLAQRRRVSVNLVSRLARPRTLRSKPGRLAVADLILLLLTVAMLTSGFWDLIASHPTRIRWHAITGVALTGLLISHTIRRWQRLATSKIR
jgi:protein-S-isoprenylcysteine O-methyltransferase Ste14